ncbi:ATP-binding protein [Streptomyces olivoreticuli]|uniref:ATP-binding protein n=1 Tax=Streptomyces olivoreticuli TaxID=68246 RepID=UPI000E23EA7A|nr:ATP-binding protein [Streptomyces olivoreticuli]
MVLPRRWWTKPSTTAFVQRLSWLALPITALWVGSGVYEIVTKEQSPVEKWCQQSHSSGCAVTYGFLAPFLTIGLATFIFLSVQYLSVRRPLSRTARKNPRSLVPTAGPTIKDVVGRKEMCLVLSRALRDRRTRRPYLLVGGVGAGKTSVLVELTQMLAKKGAIPVPVRLRDADMDRSRLDFRELGMKRFCEEVDHGVLSGRQAERVWRQLCMDDKAVILADGLEETFTEGEKQKERDVLIRKAIERAERQKLPLVIASRPHPPLQQTQAAVIDLEPLSEEAALEYLEKDRTDPDPHRMSWIVETAAVSEAPLYLQIAHELQDHHLLEHLTGISRSGELDTRSADRAELHLRLLDTWREALISGRIHGEIALPSDKREATIEVISALAGIGLLQDRLEVAFDALIGVGPDDAGPDAARAWGHVPTAAPAFPGIWKRLTERLPECPGLTDMHRCRTLLSLCATQGEQLGLVEVRGERVRFPHSILQAYLGSGYVGVSVTASLQEPGPGRELLVALVLNSRKEDSRKEAENRHEAVVQRLREAAEKRTDAKALDLYAAALDIDSATGASAHQEIVTSLRDRWQYIAGGDRRTLQGAKEDVVHRVGDVLRAIGARSEKQPDGPAPAYAPFFEIAENEPSYPIRLAIAQEIGAGGDNAFDVLRTMFPLPENGPPEENDPWVQYETALREQLHAEHRTREEDLRSPVSGDQAHKQYKEHKKESDEQRSRIWRRFTMRAWLVPMMVGSVGDKHRNQAKERLRLWLAHLEPEHSASQRADLPLSLEIALAQGFKSAANRRERHPHTHEEPREYLVEEAEAMLTHARFWYSQLTLIHALCLWELRDGTSRPSAKADPTQSVKRWLALAGSKQDPVARHPDDRTRRGERLHPFVAEAAGLAVLALESGHPERFIWIDEMGVMNNIGSSPADPGVYRRHTLWIPPSVGWSTLHPRAQQLLADVLLLLNLVQRSGRPEELEARLARADRCVLPPCLDRDREPLRPRRTVGMAEDAPPGSTCARDCPFELCPYPAMGEQPRAEMREAFCRQQQALLRPYRRVGVMGPLSWMRRRRAPWHRMTCSELHRFWEDMAARSRTPSS